MSSSRTSTRLGIGVVCAATVAAGTLTAVPGAAEAARSTGTPAQRIAIQPGTLDKAPRARAVHQRKRTIYDGKRTVRVKGPKGQSLVAESGVGYVTVRYGSYHGRLHLIRPGRKPRRVGFVPNAGYNGGGEQYAVSASGKRLAYAVPDRSGTDLLYVRTLPSGKSVRSGEWIDPGASVVDYPGKRLVLASYTGTRWYSPDTGERERITTATAEVADVEHNLMVLRGDRAADPFRLVAFDDPEQPVAAWQRGRPIAFSPNGRYVLTKDGDHRVQIRATKDGDVVRTFTAARRITGSARWETNRRVLLTAWGHKVAANVRCTVGGQCERTTRLAKRPGRLGITWP